MKCSAWIATTAPPTPSNCLTGPWIGPWREARFPRSLPFVKKTAIELLKASYTSEEDAAQKIPAALNAFYQQKYGDVWAKRSNDIQLRDKR